MTFSTSIRNFFVGASLLASLALGNDSRALDAENDVLGFTLIGPSHVLVTHEPTMIDLLEFKRLPATPANGPLTVAIDGLTAGADLDLSDGVDGDEVSTAQEVADPWVWCALDEFDFGPQPGPIDELITRACTE